MDAYLAGGIEFAKAVASYWYWWLTAVPFGIDQILSRNFWSKEENGRISTRWPEESRHKFFKRLALVGLFVSCFLAFNRVNSELKEQVRTNAELQAGLKAANDQLVETRHQLAEATKWIPLQERPTLATGSVVKNSVFRDLTINSGDIGFEIGGPVDISRFRRKSNRYYK